MGGPKGWGPKKKVANIEIYVIFEVFAFCGRRTKTDFKDRGTDILGTTAIISAVIGIVLSSHYLCIDEYKSD